MFTREMAAAAKADRSGTYPSVVWFVIVSFFRKILRDVMTNWRMKMTTYSDTYICTICKRGFRNDEELFEHLTSRANKCNMCFYCGPEKHYGNDLRRHFRTDHSNFHCPICDDTFFLRENLNAHMRQHISLRTPTEPFRLHLPGMKAGEDLSTFAKRLRPSRSFYAECFNIKERLQHFIQYNTSFKRSIVFMTGSIGKETADSPGTDIDLMLYFRSYPCEIFVGSVDSIIDRLKRHVENGDMNWARELRFERTTPYSVQFKLRVGDGKPIPVDLLPAVFLLTPNSRKGAMRKGSVVSCGNQIWYLFRGWIKDIPDNMLYRKMKKMHPRTRKHCQRFLSHVQVEFVKDIPEALKDVIRIIKSWAKKIRKLEKCTTVRSYFCELVTIDTWRKEGSPANDQIDIDYFTKCVLYHLCFCPTMRIVWPEQYQHHIYIPEYDAPMVLDPANPFCNVAPNERDAASVSRHARDLLKTEPLASSTVIDLEHIYGKYAYTGPSRPRFTTGRVCCVILLFVMVLLLIYYSYIHANI